MGVKVSSNMKATKFEYWLDNAVEDVQMAANSAVEAAVETGQQSMTELIMSRGTNKQWSRPWPSRNGGRRSGSTEARYDTGEMVNSVTSYFDGISLDSFGNDSASGEYGWLGNQQEYFRYQEEGFTHYRSGEAIPAMNALRDSYVEAQNALKAELKRQGFKRA